MCREDGFEYTGRVAGPDSVRHPRWRNGAPWRDPDVWHVLAVGAAAAVLTAGLAYAWFFARTLRTAQRSGRDSGEARCAIVFGKRLAGGRPDREFRWRLRHALRLLRARPELIVLLAGGTEPDAVLSEAEAGRRWLLGRMPEAAPRLLVEERSRDTVDNLREARRLLPSGPVALISNRYHLARCAVLARSLAFDARCCAAEPWLRYDAATWRRLGLEAGYHMLFVLGRRWARLIGHRRMLSRVS